MPLDPLLSSIEHLRRLCQTPQDIAELERVKQEMRQQVAAILNMSKGTKPLERAIDAAMMAALEARNAELENKVRFLTVDYNSIATLQNDNAELSKQLEDVRRDRDILRERLKESEKQRLDMKADIGRAAPLLQKYMG